MGRYLWAGPGSMVGVLLAMLTWRRAHVAIVDGVLEVHSPGLAWALAHLTPLCGGAAAITFGHVVLARDQAALDDTRAHERVHVRQYEVWGPLFIPAYVASSIWAWLRGGDPYLDNIFEREAFLKEPV